MAAEPLLDRVWAHVDHFIGPNGVRRKDVQRALALTGRQRNKNTYTKWFSPRRKHLRPDLRITDLEDLARALHTDPETLVGPSPPDKSAHHDVPQQLVLPFPVGTDSLVLEVNRFEDAVVLRFPVT